MQKITNLIAGFMLVIAASGLVLAEDARKEALLDTGKGGFKLLVSVPSFAQGPYDFAKNNGVNAKEYDGFRYSEVMYNAPLSETSVVIYQALGMRRFVAKKGAVPITADHLANEMLKTNGFKLARATKIDCPKVPVEGGSIACYKASGHSIFDGEEKKRNKKAMVVVGISFANNTQGYALMATVAEKNIAAFDKEPDEYVRMAKNGVGNMLKNQQLQLR